MRVEMEEGVKIRGRWGAWRARKGKGEGGSRDDGARARRTRALGQVHKLVSCDKKSVQSALRSKRGHGGRQ